jgi:acetyltransferase-like isoleucine patch superfamily enzyme
VIQRSFKINILDDNIVEENEVFQVVLEVPEGGGSVGAQFRTNVTIIDDDAPLISAKLSKILQNTTSVIAGQPFSVSVQAVAADGMQLTMGGERFLAIIENDVSILHEVTLGGTGKECGDRHPIVRSGVLLGAGAKILGRVEIGTGAKVGAGSVVLNDVPAHTTVAGVPAVIVGESREENPAIEMDQSLECRNI